MIKQLTSVYFFSLTKKTTASQQKKVLKRSTPTFTGWKMVIVILIFSGLCVPFKLLAQTKPKELADSIRTGKLFEPKETIKGSYPRAVGYLSFIVPIVTVNKNSTTMNFNGTTRIGFPVGVNVLYSERFGFSYEFTPTIEWDKGNSKVSNILFDPGTMFRFQKGFTIISRLAFETSGRYGFTPVFNKVYLRTKAVNYFAALSAPARFGNSAPASIGLNVQFGFIFN